MQNKEKYKVTPKNDIVFKKIFGSKGNEGILKDFLESILEIEISSLKLDLNTEILPEFYDGKTSRLDVLAKLENGTLVDIEVQIDASGYNEKRCLEYWSRLYTKELEKGAHYSELNKTICIWIVDEIVYKDFEKFESTWKIGEVELGFIDRFKDFEIHVIELKKFRRLDIMKPKRKEFWLWFIDHTNEELVKMGRITEERLEEAYEEYMRITSDKDLMTAIINRHMYEQDQIARQKRMSEQALKDGLEKGMKQGVKQGMKQGMKQGLKEGKKAGKKEGIKEGIEKNKKETAKKLLKVNMDIEQIMEVTGLSKKEIEELNNENN